MANECDISSQFSIVRMHCGRSNFERIRVEIPFAVDCFSMAVENHTGVTPDAARICIRRLSHS